MKSKLQERHAIRFCVRLGDRAAGKIQKASGKDSVPRVQYFDGTKTLQMGEKRAVDETRCGSPSSVGTGTIVDCVETFSR
jgi:hypothetical protein